MISKILSWVIPKHRIKGELCVPSLPKTKQQQQKVQQNLIATKES